MHNIVFNRLNAQHMEGFLFIMYYSNSAYPQAIIILMAYRLTTLAPLNEISILKPKGYSDIKKFIKFRGSNNPHWRYKKVYKVPWKQ